MEISLLISIALFVIVLLLFYIFMEKNKNRESNSYNEIKELINNSQISALKEMQQNSNNNFLSVTESITKYVNEALSQSNSSVDKNVKGLQEQVESKLEFISEKMDNRLSNEFVKNNDVFSKLVERISIIDNAQTKITELSENVVTLQNILSDKQSRGAFGEVQLKQIIDNIMPQNYLKFQRELSNGTRVDCSIIMPENKGDISIDSKFPLENYKKMVNTEQTANEKKQHERLFKQDVKKHIDDISKKYIIPNETADNAIMFLPSEAIFAEIHAYHYDLVEYSHKNKVVLTSPNTLVALLNSIRALLKDETTQKQIHIIQKQLILLSGDFDRFQGRIEDLSKHIKQANDDVEKVKISSKKIFSHFKKIEKAEIIDKNDDVTDENSE